MSVRLAVTVAALVGMCAPEARAYCPSYTPAGTAGGKNCSIEPALGHNPTLTEWNTIFSIVSAGPAVWGTNGPTSKSLKRGCNLPTAPGEVAPTFPCAVLKAIAMAESGWQQFCTPTSPASAVGKPERTIVSFDCGYGVGQVTSGMRVGEAPDFDRARVASEATYNLATGTRILRDKWDGTRCVGDRLPEIVEHWYTAVWAYNGLAYTNNPNNPNLTASRKPYNPRNGGSYTYQERVFGRMEYPTSSAHWSSLAVAYPDRAKIPASGGNPGAIPNPDCEGPTSCVGKRPLHQGSCGNEGRSWPGGFGETIVQAPESGPRTPPALVTENADLAPEEAEGCSHRVRGSPSAGPMAVIMALAAIVRRARKRRLLIR
jgi:hypothetical protein